MLGDDEDCTMSTSQIVEAYSQTFFLRGENAEIKNMVDFAELDDLVWNIARDMKAKDVFSILDVHFKS